MGDHGWSWVICLGPWYLRWGIIHENPRMICLGWVIHGPWSKKWVKWRNHQEFTSTWSKNHLWIHHKSPFRIHLSAAQFRLLKRFGSLHMAVGGAPEAHRTDRCCNVLPAVPGEHSVSFIKFCEILRCNSCKFAATNFGVDVWLPMGPIDESFARWSYHKSRWLRGYHDGYGELGIWRHLQISHRD